MLADRIDVSARTVEGDTAEIERLAPVGVFLDDLVLDVAVPHLVFESRGAFGEARLGAAVHAGPRDRI